MPTDKLDSSLSDQCCPDTDPDIFVFKHFDNSSSSNVELPMLSSVMMRPLYLENSAWIGHIPFAFWIIEAQKPHILVELGVYYGVSYFAFCQAVERLGLDASCFAVDTWKGDEHAGYYDESVYEQFKRYNDFHYSEFSFLIRNSFDNAKDYFTDGTIDLLHIDGLHTYEAVKHDFENWLPKLSSRAIVLFHDSNVREREFGVFKFVQELRDTYPSFEFMHGHGLSVFGVGRNQDSVFDNLFKMKDHDRNKANISKVFGLLGKSCVDAHHLNVRTDKLSSSERLSKKLESEIQKLRENQEKLLPRLQLADQAQERIAGIEKESQIQVAIIQDKLQTFQEQLLAEQKFNERLLVQIERCNQEVQEREAAETKLRDQIAAQDTALAQLKTQAAQQADQAKAEREGLLVEREAAETKLRDQIAAQDTALTQLKTQAAQQADQAKAEREGLLVEREAAETKLRDQIAAQDTALAQLKTQAAQQADQAKAEREGLLVEREAAETKLRDQIAAQDTALTQLKTQAAQQADQAKAEREGLLVEREAAETKLRDQIAAQDTALAQLKTQAAQQADQAKAEREGLLVEREAAETKLRDQIAAQDTALTQLKTQAAQQADQAKAEREGLLVEREAAETKLRDQIAAQDTALAQLVTAHRVWTIFS